MNAYRREAERPDEEFEALGASQADFDAMISPNWSVNMTMALLCVGWIGFGLGLGWLIWG